MSIIIGHASIDENGNAYNGQAGDQTKKEVTTRSYYLHSKGWYLLRPISVEHANAIAKAMLRACENDNIGYDQYNRLGIIKYGTNSKVKTECDCSSLVRQCVIEGTGVDAGNFTTDDEKNKLYATGLFEKPIDVTSNTIVYDGDILVTKTKGHTVTVVSGNSRTSQITGSYLTKTISDLNLRSSASSANKSNIIIVIPNNTYVCITKDNSSNWVQVQTIINGSSYTGYVSKNYLKTIDISKYEKRKVIAGGLNVRTEPNVSSSKVFTMNKGDIFTVVTSDKWGLILFNNKLGYANLSNSYSNKI